MMTQQPLNQNLKTQAILKSVETGMDVYDITGDKFGEVDDLYFGAVGDEIVDGVEPATTSEAPVNAQDELIQDFAKALGGEDDLPEELRQRLLHDGYIRIDANGLFAADRFVLPDQIASVDDKGVHLRVARRDLIKR